MLEIETWMNGYIAAVRSAFGDRVRYIGLQGSRARGEAGPDSDIDVVCILDECSLADLETYREAVKDLPEREKLCGFVSGAREIENWDRGELFFFRRDTVDHYRHLRFLIPAEEAGDAKAALRQGACGLYHLCCHNFLHGRSREAVAAGYKSAEFLLRAKVYLEQGVWCRTRGDLARVLTGRDWDVIETAVSLRAGTCREDLSVLTDRLLTWCREILAACGE